MDTVIADSGALAGWFNRNDQYHGRATAFFERFSGRLITTWPVLTETVHLCPTHIGVKFLRWVDAGGATVSEMPPRALSIIAGLVEKYQDSDMDVTDASLIWLAHTSGVLQIITVDDDHFAAYRTPRGKGLRNLL